MSISQDEARESLNQVADATERTRKLLAYASVDKHFIVWGMVWVLGFCSSQFLPLLPWIWLGLLVAGFVASALIGMNEPIRSTMGRRFGLFWVFLIAYVCLWMWLLSPFITVGQEQTMAFWRHMVAIGVTIAMFAYVVMGVWLDTFVIWVGLAVTALSVLGLFVAPDYFFLWTAATGGGTLVGTGLLIHNRWR